MNQEVYNKEVNVLYSDYNSSINGMNMSQHMINTYQNINNWNNYLYQMQMFILKNYVK